MTRRIVTVLMALAIVVSIAPSSGAKTRWRGRFIGPLTMRGGPTWPSRSYYVYVPKRLAPGSRRSLVVILHGTTQTARDVALSTRWNDLADSEGFVVAYPEQSEASNGVIDNDGANGARAWAIGRAVFEGRDTGEFRTIANITRKVMREFKVDKGRVYLGGLSAGANMGAIQVQTYPDLYAAFASWAGCSHMCADPTGVIGYQRMGKHARVVPAILFSGTADYVVPLPLTATQLTSWVLMNDLADDGQPNGSVSWTPTDGPTTRGGEPDSVQPSPNTGPTDGSQGDAGTCLYASQPKGNNPCPAGVLGWKSYPYTVTRYGYAASPKDVVVESWYIHGVSHNYTGGHTDGNYADPHGPDTTRAAWRFFSAHARR